jgi:hypothetical protein
MGRGELVSRDAFADVRRSRLLGVSTDVLLASIELRDLARTLPEGSEDRERLLRLSGWLTDDHAFIGAVLDADNIA